MKNEIDTIDGYKGEWRTVTQPSELTLGQRVRYDAAVCRFGFSDSQEEGDRVRFIGGDEDYGADASSLFEDFEGPIQAFFPFRDNDESVDKNELVNSLQETMRTLAFVTFLSLRDHPDTETTGSIEAVLKRARDLIAKHKTGDTL